MAPSSTPITAPIEKVRIVRQGRHALNDPAEHQLLDQAAGSERPLVLKQRIARDRHELQQLRRRLPDLTDIEQRFEIEAAMRTLVANIQAGNQALNRLVESGRTRRWGPSDFEPGDEVRYLAAWYQVVRVGPVGLTVQFRSLRGGGPGDVPAEYTKITGRRRNGAEEVDAA
jgi:hypothetical protein